MAKLIFKIGPASHRLASSESRQGSRGVKYGRSGIEIIIKNGDKIYKKTTENTDDVLSTLDTLLKSAKIKVESLRDIKIEAHKEAGLTSLRIIKSITKALSFSL